MYDFNDYIKDSLNHVSNLKNTPVFGFIIKYIWLPIDDNSPQKLIDIEIIGFVNKRGKLFKLFNTIKLSSLLKFRKQINLEKSLLYLPKVHVLSNEDSLMTLFDTYPNSLIKQIDTNQQIKIEKRIKILLKRKQKIRYTIYYDFFSGYVFANTKKKHDKIIELYTTFENDKLNAAKIRSTILHNRYNIICNIQKHRDNLKKYLLTHTKNDKEIHKFQQLFQKEKTKVEKSLSDVVDNAKKQYEWVSNCVYYPKKEDYLAQKEKQIFQLQEIIKKFHDELQASTDDLKTAQQEKIILLQNIYAKDKILDEFSDIKQQLTEHYDKWKYWFENECSMIPEHQIEQFLSKNKKLLIKEMNSLKNKFKELITLINNSDLINAEQAEKIKLQQNISELELIMQKFLTEQFTELSKYQSKKIELKQQDLLDLETSLNKYTDSIQTYINEISNLIYLTNQKLPIINEDELYNYQDCMQNFKQFVNVNNTFVRLNKMSKNLDKIVDILNVNYIIYKNNEFELINADDKTLYTTNLEKIKNNLSELLQKIKLSDIYNNQQYQSVISNPIETNSISIGLCTQMSYKLTIYTSSILEIKELLSQIEDIIHQLQEQRLNDSILKLYSKVPNVSIRKTLLNL